MEREFAEASPEFENIGVSEKEEDKAVENPTITVHQQLKKAKAATQAQVQKGQNIYLKATKTVWKALENRQKKKKDIFVEE